MLAKQQRAASARQMKAQTSTHRKASRVQNANEALAHRPCSFQAMIAGLQFKSLVRNLDPKVNERVSPRNGNREARRANAQNSDILDTRQVLPQPSLCNRTLQPSNDARFLLIDLHSILGQHLKNHTNVRTHAGQVRLLPDGPSKEIIISKGRLVCLTPALMDALINQVT